MNADVATTTLWLSGHQSWYLCLTKPRQEDHAQHKLNEQGYDTFLPPLTRWLRKAGRWHRQTQPMFPRYVFVRPSNAGHGVGPIRSTPGVSTLIRFGPTLATCPDERLQALRSVCDAMAQALPEQPFEPGMHVVFTEGPLKGAQGVVSSVSAERVHVMLSLLGYRQALGVPARGLAMA